MKQIKQNKTYLRIHIPEDTTIVWKIFATFCVKYMGAGSTYWGLEINQVDVEYLSDKLNRFYRLSQRLVQNKDLRKRDSEKCWLLSDDRKNINFAAEMVQSKDNSDDPVHINTWFENVGKLFDKHCWKGLEFSLSLSKHARKNEYSIKPSTRSYAVLFVPYI